MNQHLATALGSHPELQPGTRACAAQLLAGNTEHWHAWPEATRTHIKAQALEAARHIDVAVRTRAAVVVSKILAHTVEGRHGFDAWPELLPFVGTMLAPDAPHAATDGALRVCARVWKQVPDLSVRAPQFNALFSLVVQCFRHAAVECRRLALDACACLVLGGDVTVPLSRAVGEAYVEGLVGLMGDGDGGVRSRVCEALTGMTEDPTLLLPHLSSVLPFVLSCTSRTQACALVRV